MECNLDYRIVVILNTLLLGGFPGGAGHQPTEAEVRSSVMSQISPTYCITNIIHKSR